MANWRANQALRREVYGRDDFTCQRCRWRPGAIPVPYSGKRTVYETVRFTFAHEVIHNGEVGTVARALVRCHVVRKLTLDHVIPRALGGEAYAAGNLQTLCGDCNSAKGAT